ncbi:AraC family transcriptional regulator ligand-binding domain-containing protein [Streptomyces sp. NPDC086023]|uniref:AraC family transcriptional regulator n=1 Tax=Streptomyces sp. NPDC086023 TaxID=3365746 RepID=UPI0037D63068
MSGIQSASVSAGYALAVFNATSRGVGRAPWSSNGERLPFAEVRALWDAALAGPGADPDVGLRVGDRIRPDNLHILGHVVLGCASLAEGAAAAERYHPLVSEAGSVTRCRRDGVAEVHYRPVDPAALHPQQVEAVIAGMVRAARWIAGDDWTPLSVSFMHGRVAAAEAYARVLGCPVSFGAPQNAIRVTDAEFDRRRAPSDPALGALHRAYAERLLEHLGGSTPVSRLVERWLEHAPLQGVRADDAAQKVGLGVRSLRRALAGDGTSWRELLDSARHGRATELLETTALPLDRVAAAVGLSGAAALVRAFTRWEGMPPGAYRARRAGGKGGAVGHRPPADGSTGGPVRP